ncbi:D-alanine-D-alanine ligase [Clostridium punense]|uniref:D-alanine--D-alanine ligase n=2 Tax=root TaxID=1 RepID=A0ABS4K1U3_9CLOT|nr:D-alanine--D-alanine ligase family protein [Clostridium punense]MBP2021106.1 D-alanine-D-alanine ligase [Clostridium punense]
MKKNVAILFGGQSTEHEVSRVSATSVLNHINNEKYNIYPIGITKEGKWFLYKGEYENIASGQWEQDNENKVSNGLEVLVDKKVEVVFPVLHGMYGEDGTIQGLCKLMNIPCVGPSVMSSAVCMDKIYTKYLLEHGNIKQAKYVVVTTFDYKKDSSVFVKAIEENLGYPCFVKPANSGSSVGITKAHNREELVKGLELALNHDRKVLVEEGLNAREIEVSVLGNDDPKASIPGEIIPAKEFYDYEAKYQNAASKLLIPAALPEEKLSIIRDLAVKIYKKLDCSGMARVDFLVDKDTEEVYLNEVNTIPGFTSISMYPKMWEATGLSYPALIDELIELAIERNNS